MYLLNSFVGTCVCAVQRQAASHSIEKRDKRLLLLNIWTFVHGHAARHSYRPSAERIAHPIYLDRSETFHMLPGGCCRLLQRPPFDDDGNDDDDDYDDGFCTVSAHS